MFFCPSLDNIISSPKDWIQTWTGRISDKIDIFPLYLGRSESFFEKLFSNFSVMLSDLMRDHAYVFRGITVFKVGKYLTFVGHNTNAKSVCSRFYAYDDH